MKPELFRHEGLYDAEVVTGLPLRLAFIGLLTCCDREGRFQWRPRTLKTEVFPFDNLDFSLVLDALATHGFIARYAVNGEDLGVVPTFKKHQVINNRERESELAAPGSQVSRGVSEMHASMTRDARAPIGSNEPSPRAIDGLPESLAIAQVEQEQEQEQEQEERQAAGAAPVSVLETFVDSWNSRCGRLPKVRELTEGRRRKLKTRVAQGLMLELFERAAHVCATTPFLRGESAQGWKASFDWLLENDTHIAAVLEGKYSGGPGPRPVDKTLAQASVGTWDGKPSKPGKMRAMVSDAAFERIRSAVVAGTPLDEFDQAVWDDSREAEKAEREEVVS